MPWSRKPINVFHEKNPSVSEALKENAEALSTEEPSHALWKKNDGMWRRWENMLWHKEELWNAINTNEQDLFFCGSFLMIGLYSFRRGCCCNRMRLHYSLLGVSVHTLCLHICGTMYCILREVIELQAPGCHGNFVAHMFLPRSFLGVKLTVLPLTPKYETINHAHTHVILFWDCKLIKIWGR